MILDIFLIVFLLLQVWAPTQELFKREGKYLTNLALYALSLTALPVTCTELSLDPTNLLIKNRRSVIDIGFMLEPSPDIIFLISAGLAFIPVAVLTAQRFGWWTKPTYGVAGVLVIMRTMKTQSWSMVNTGFLLLLYSVYGFFTC